MSFTYQSYQQVPSDIIGEIGGSIFNRLEKKLSEFPTLDYETVEFIKLLILKSINEVVKENSLTSNGFTLDRPSILKIAGYIKAGMRVDAVKELRHASGSLLRPTVDFINSFTLDEAGSIKFIQSFT